MTAVDSDVGFIGSTEADNTPSPGRRAKSIHASWIDVRADHYRTLLKIPTCRRVGKIKLDWISGIQGHLRHTEFQEDPSRLQLYGSSALAISDTSATSYARSYAAAKSHADSCRWMAAAQLVRNDHLMDWIANPPALTRNFGMTTVIIQRVMPVRTPGVLGESRIITAARRRLVRDFVEALAGSADTRVRQCFCSRPLMTNRSSDVGSFRGWAFYRDFT